MVKKHVAVFALVILLAALPETVRAQDATTLLTTAAKAMGAENLKTIQYSGSGTNAGIGQNRNPGAPWPLVRVKSYTREMDFDAPASRLQVVRDQNGTEQTQNQTILPNAPWANQFDVWLSPYAFLKGAIAGPATLEAKTVAGERFNVVTFTRENRYKVSGYFDQKNMIYKVETWVDNPVFGDMLVEAVYRDYKDFSGVQFPTTIINRQGGKSTLVLVVSDVKPNAPVSIQPQQTQGGGGGGAPPVSVQAQRISDGVFYLMGGSHHSVAVEFADHIAVIEAPQNEARSLAVIAEVKKQIPNKPIRYLLNTHHHFDHSGGLRTYVDEGATIVTHQINKDFYSKTLTAPRTLNPDRLAQSRKLPTIEAVGDKRVLSDNTRTIELHLIKDNPHNDGILMAYLPNERILIEVDVYTPPAPNAPAPTAVNPNTENLVANVERLKLDFERILPLHGPGVAMKADLYRAVGKTPAAN